MGDEKTRRETDKRVLKTKKAIKAAHLSIMEEKDISDITISELTRKAGINRRTFYTHYRSISDIIDEIESDMVALLSEVVQKIDVTDIRKSAYNVFIELNEMVAVEFDYYFSRVRMDMRGVFMTRLKGIASELADKLLSENSNLSRETAEMISEYIVGGFFNVFVEWRTSGGNIPVEQAARLAGIMAEGCLESIRKLR
ncbi:MAG: TetR/AcrR family transcriptional regulator [Oscillospiraceae bacterium]|nr:TetR/AcrR family transcriptional regulator [Oscillospiraceae bacterium]